MYNKAEITNNMLVMIGFKLHPSQPSLLHSNKNTYLPKPDHWHHHLRHIPSLSKKTKKKEMLASPTVTQKRTRGWWAITTEQCACQTFCEMRGIQRLIVLLKSLDFLHVEVELEADGYIQGDTCQLEKHISKKGSTSTSKRRRYRPPFDCKRVPAQQTSETDEGHPHWPQLLQEVPTFFFCAGCYKQRAKYVVFRMSNARGNDTRPFTIAKISRPLS